MLVRRHLYPQYADDVCLVFDVRSFQCLLLIILPFIRRIAKSNPSSRKWHTLVLFAEEQLGTTHFVSRRGVLYENILNIVLEFMEFDPALIYDYWTTQLDKASKRMTREIDYIQYCNYLQKGMRAIRILHQQREDKEVRVYQLKHRLMMVDFRRRGWCRRVLDWFRYTRRLVGRPS